MKMQPSAGIFILFAFDSIVAHTTGNMFIVQVKTECLKLDFLLIIWLLLVIYIFNSCWYFDRSQRSFGQCFKTVIDCVCVWRADVLTKSIHAEKTMRKFKSNRINLPQGQWKCTATIHAKLFLKCMFCVHFVILNDRDTPSVWLFEKSIVKFNFIFDFLHLCRG